MSPATRTHAAPMPAPQQSLRGSQASRSSRQKLVQARHAPIEKNGAQSAENIRWSLGDLNLEPRRTPSSAGARTLPPALGNALNVSHGESLPAGMAADFGERFGWDVSQVTIHRDHDASEAVNSIAANAFTHGSKLFFRDGAYQPHSPSGQALLTHEMAHAVQQMRGEEAKSSPPSARPAETEAHAAQSAQLQLQGRKSFGSGPASPIAVAADTGFTYEDEDAKVSVLSTRDEAADRVVDLESQADQARAATGVTDAQTAHVDEKAQKLRDSIQTPTGSKKKSKHKKAVASGPNSSKDLRDANPDQVEAYRRELAKAQILNPDPKERARLAREIENTQLSAEDARKREEIRYTSSRITDLQSKIEQLELDVNYSNELRRSTSSWVTGPVHAYGGAWNEIEITEFQGTNVALGQAKESLRKGNLTEANEEINQSFDKYLDLDSRFQDYAEGIQRGGGRVVKGLEIAHTAGQIAASRLNPLAGEVYNVGTAYLEDKGMERRGLSTDADPMDILQSGPAPINPMIPNLGPEPAGPTGVRTSPEPEPVMPIEEPVTSGPVAEPVATPAAAETPIQEVVPPSPAKAIEPPEPTRPVSQEGPSASKTSHAPEDPSVRKSANSPDDPSVAKAAKAPDEEAILRASKAAEETHPGKPAASTPKRKSPKGPRRKSKQAQQKKAAQEQEKAEFQRSKAADEQLEEGDVTGRDRRTREKEKTQSRQKDRASSRTDAESQSAAAAKKRVMKMSGEAKAGRFKSLSPKNKLRQLRRFKKQIKNVRRGDLPQIKNKMVGDFDENVRTPRKTAGNPQDKYLAGGPALDSHELPAGRSSYAQPDYSIRVEPSASGRARVHVNLKSHELRDIKASAARSIASNVVAQAKRNAFHLPKGESIVISFAETPTKDIQGVITAKIFGSNNPIVEVRFGTTTIRR